MAAVTEVDSETGETDWTLHLPELLAVIMVLILARTVSFNAKLAKSLFGNPPGRGTGPTVEGDSAVSRRPRWPSRGDSVAFHKL